MARDLRAGTACIVPVGPPYDKTDGVTAETSLTITSEAITLTRWTMDGAAPTLVLDNIAGATSGTANDLNYITDSNNGQLQIEFQASDLVAGTQMRLTITDAATHCPIIEDFNVLPADVYDELHTRGSGVVFGTAATGTLTTTSFTTSLTVAADQYNGRTLTFLSGTLIGQSRKILDSVASGGRLDFYTGAGFTAAPSNGDVFKIT